MALNTLNLFAAEPQPISETQFLNPNLLPNRGQMIVAARRQWLTRALQTYRREHRLSPGTPVDFADVYDYETNGQIMAVNKAQTEFALTRQEPLVKANPPMETLFSISERDLDPNVQINLFKGEAARRMFYDLGYRGELEPLRPNSHLVIPGVRNAPIFESDRYIGDGYFWDAPIERGMRIETAGELWVPTISRVFPSGTEFSNYHLGLSLHSTFEPTAK